jgi:mRNA-degrading endonuclease RelE of RelBE toxin-antitoxin system
MASLYLANECVIFNSLRQCRIMAVFGFIETRLFTRLVQEYLTDEDYRDLQVELMENPRAGKVISGSGGVRKIRWAANGRGKRGGYRVIYFVRHPKAIIWMLTIYPKSTTDSIPGHVLKQIREELENE